MSEATAKPNLTPFPVKVTTIVPTRIDFEAFAPCAAEDMPEYCDPAAVGFKVLVRYRVEEDSGVVVVIAESAFEPEHKGDGSASQGQPVSHRKPPYRLNVAATASFVYDSTEISKDEVAKWCDSGSFFILAPYVRELISDLTARSGFAPIVLPLVLLPILRGNVNTQAAKSSARVPRGARAKKS